MAVRFDTLAYARRLRDAGLTEEQAAVHAEALAAALDEILVTKQDLRDIATKEDLHRLELATRDDFAAVREEMRAEFAAVRQEMAGGFAAVRQEVAGEFAAVRQEVVGGFAAVRQEVRALEQRMTVRFGAMFAVGFGALATLIKLG